MVSETWKYDQAQNTFEEKNSNFEFWNKMIDYEKIIWTIICGTCSGNVWYEFESDMKNVKCE